MNVENYLENKMEGKEKVYYKVVKGFNENKYYSSWIRNENCVEYKLNEWIKAPQHQIEKGYHLLVFDDIVEVRRYCVNLSKFPLLIFKCKIKGIIENKPKMKSCFGGIIDYNAFDNNNEYLNWPKGTIMTKEVMIFGEPL